MTSLWAMARFVFLIGQAQSGKKPLLHEPYLWYFYNELDRRFADGTLHRTWLAAARGHHKTLGMSLLCLREIIKDPMLRIAYGSLTKEAAEERAGYMRLEMEGNKLLSTFWPDIFWENPREEAPPGSWSENSFTVKREGHGKGMIESTVKAYGLKVRVTPGQHFDWHIADDIEERTLAESPNQVERLVRNTLDWYKVSDKKRRSDRSFRPVIGTPYLGGPVYRKLEEQGAIDHRWVESAIDLSKPRPDLIDIGGGEPRFLSVDELRDERGRGQQRGEDYAAQYLIQIERPDNVLSLKMGDVRTYFETPREAAIGAKVIVLSDSAGSSHISRAAKLDNTAFVVLGLKYPDRIFLLDAVVDLLRPAQRLDTGVRLCKKWGASLWRQESAQNDDISHVAEWMKKHSYSFRYEAFPRGGGSSAQGKKQRIFSYLDPLIAADRLFFPRSMSRRVRGAQVDLIDMIKKAGENLSSTDEDHWADAMCLLLDRPAVCEFVQGASGSIQQGPPSVVRWPASTGPSADSIASLSGRDTIRPRGFYGNGFCGITEIPKEMA